MYIILFFSRPNIMAQEPWLPTNGPNKGVVSSLVVDPEGRIYAGTLYGGMFISTDQGHHWEQIGSQIPAREIRTMALTPDGCVYVGTGNGYVFVSKNQGVEWALSVSLPSEVHTILVDGNGHLFVGTGGHGVFKLANSDTTWSQTNLGQVSVQCLAFGSSNELYAATNLGLFRSSYEGDTWQRMDIPNIYIFSMISDFDGRLFAGTWSGEVYYSQNKGESWVSFNLGPKNSIIRTICIDREGIIYAGVCNGGLFKSEDRGNSWKALNDGLTDLGVRSIAIGFNGDIFVGTSSGIIFKSSGSAFSLSKNAFDIFTYSPLNFE